MPASLMDTRQAMLKLKWTTPAAIQSKKLNFILSICKWSLKLLKTGSKNKSKDLEDSTATKISGLTSHLRILSIWHFGQLKIAKTGIYT